MRRVLAALVALLGGIIITLGILSLLISDAFLGAPLQLVLLLLFLLLIDFLMVLGLAFWAPRTWLLVAILSALPALVIGVIVFLGMVAEQGVRLALLWLMGALSVLAVGLLAAWLGARLRGRTQ